MLTLYQKYHIYLNLLLITLLGLACGLLATTLLEALMEPLPTQSYATVQSSEENTQELSLADLNLILQRNLFDPASRSASATMEPVDSAGAEEGNDTPRQQAAPRNMTLLGTVVAGEESMALIEIDKKLEIYHLDDELPGGSVIEEIARNLVKIRNRDKTLTTLMLVQDDPGTSSPARTAASASPARNDTGADIKQIDDGHWVVPRDTAEKTRANLAVEMRLAQLQPRITDGKTDGFMIRRLRRNSILNKLGLQRGDVIMQVNNMTLDSPETALQIFQQLREARQITVGIERKGTPQTFTYELD